MRSLVTLFFIILFFTSNGNSEEYENQCDIFTSNIDIVGSIIKSGIYDNNLIDNPTGNSKLDNSSVSKNTKYSGIICVPDVVYVPIKNNKIHGQIVFYKVKGKVSQVTNYKNGVPNGEIVVYYDNGTIESKGTLKNGLLNGKYYEYFDNGKLKTEVNYKSGVKNGNEKIYDDKGNLLTSVNYKNGNLNGETIIYVENKPWGYIYHKNSQFIKAKCAKSGRLWSKTEYDNYVLYLEIPEC